MNTVWVYSLSCGGYGWMNGSSQQPKLTGKGSGYGSIAKVHPNSGETYWWLLPYVNTPLFNRVLKDFARHFSVGEHKRIVLVLDQAGWHSSKELEVPDGIHLVFLPSHSPELQPAERLWPLTNESIANESFTCLDELEKLVIERCRTLLEHKDLIKGLTLFHWWSEVAA